MPFDRAADPDGPALDLLSADLAAAGRRARGRKSQVTSARPEIGYTSSLRNRLAPPAIPMDFLPEGVPPTPVQVRLAIPPSSRRRTRPLGLLLLIGICIALIAGAAFALRSGLLGSVAANRAGQTVDATLIRTSGSQALVAGTALVAGDEVKVASGGTATLILGSSQARLAGGADVKINALSSTTVQLALLAGRAYSRVVLPAGGTYAVVTGPYTWAATGTAFDLTRGPNPAGGERVTLLALEHSTAVSGPLTSRQITEGSTVSVVFGSPSSDELVVGSIPQSDFADPWLITNAKTDESLGYPIGALVGVALAPNDTPTVAPSATDQPTTAPTDTPLASPSPSDGPSTAPTGTPTPTERPTPTPTPSPSPSPSPSPTGTPQPTLALSSNSCTGGVILSWSKYGGAGFKKYVLLRSLSNGIPAAYPAQGGATLIASTTSLSATDASGTAGHTYFYRTLVLNSGNTVLEASNVVVAPAFAVGDLGPASVVPPYVVWNIFNGPASCFSEYRVQYSADSDFASGVKSIIVSSLKQTNVPVPSASGFSVGDTIYFRVQVVRMVGSSSFVVAQTTNSQPPSYTY